LFINKKLEKQPSCKW